MSGDERPRSDATAEERLRDLGRVLELAEFPNVSVKWANIERVAGTPYPYRDVIGCLKTLVDAFGANRVMWASDATETARADRSPYPSSWSQALHHVSDCELSNLDEKAWIIGRTARSILGLI